MEYTHLALGHGASRTEFKPALCWSIELLWYSVVCVLSGVCDGFWQLAAGGIGLALGGVWSHSWKTGALFFPSCVNKGFPSLPSLRRKEIAF